MQVADAAPAPVREHRMHWWKEALIVAVFYAVYSWTRNLFGSNAIAADGSTASCADVAPVRVTPETRFSTSALRMTS